MRFLRDFASCSALSPFCCSLTNAFFHISTSVTENSAFRAIMAALSSRTLFASTRRRNISTLQGHPYQRLGGSGATHHLVVQEGRCCDFRQVIETTVAYHTYCFCIKNSKSKESSLICKEDKVGESETVLPVASMERAPLMLLERSIAE